MSLVLVHSNTSENFVADNDSEPPKSVFASPVAFPPDRRVTYAATTKGIKTRLYTQNQYATFDPLLRQLQKRRVSETKDTPVIFPGNLIGGERDAAHVERVEAAVADIDGITREQFERICKALDDADIKYLAHTSYSHLSGLKEVSSDKLNETAKANGLFPLDTEEKCDEAARLHEPGALGVARDERDIQRMYEPSPNGGTVCVLKVPPIEKWRIWFFFDMPYIVAEIMRRRGFTEKDVRGRVWKAALIRFFKAFNIPADMACFDLPDAYYLPACPAHMLDKAEIRTGKGTKCLSLDAFVPTTIEDVDATIPPKAAKQSASSASSKAKSDTSSFKIPLSWLVKYAPTFAIEDAVPEDVKRGPRGGDKPGAAVECPFEHEHTTPGGTGCYVVNGDDNAPHGFSIQCSHTSCKTNRPWGNGTDRLVMLQEMVALGWITKEQLEDPELGGGPLDGKPSKDAIRERIKKLTSDTPVEEIQPIIDDIAAVDQPLFDAEAVESIERATNKKNKAKLNEAIKIARKKKSKNKRAEKSAEAQTGSGDGKLYLHDWEFQNETFEEYSGRGRKHFEDANRAKPRVYRRGVHAVRVVTDTTTDQLVTKPLDAASFGSEMDRHTAWSRLVMKGDDFAIKNVGTPPEIAEKILKNPELDLPTLRGLSDTPFFTASGELILDPGYHAASGVYYDPPKDSLNIPPVPDKPTSDDLAKAKALVLEPYYDFPFHDGDADPTGEASRTNIIARDITTFVRDMVDCVPFFATDKPGHDIGGTLASKVGSIITTGAPPSVETVKRTSEEWQKTLHSHALAGTRRILIDNVPRDYLINDPTLAAAGTAERLSGRILGVSEIGGGDVRWVFEFTGVNLKFSQENARRTVVIRLDAQMSNPGERDRFKHPNLIDWVLDNRSDIVWAYLVLVRHWQACGCPKPSGKSLSSFERWSEVVGGILECAGFKKFNGNRHLLDGDDARGMKEFVAAWHKAFGESEVQCGTLKAYAEKECDHTPKTLAELYYFMEDAGYLGISRKANVADTLGQRLGTKLTEYVSGVYRIGDADYKIKKQVKSTGKVYQLEKL